MDEKEKELEAQLAKIKAFKIVFESEDGKKVLDYLKDVCFYTRPTINVSDKEDLFKYREGRRSVVLEIDDILKIDLAKYRNNFIKNQLGEDEWLKHY